MGLFMVWGFVFVCDYFAFTWVRVGVCLGGWLLWGDWWFVWLGGLVGWFGVFVG